MAYVGDRRIPLMFQCGQWHSPPFDLDEGETEIQIVLYRADKRCLLRRCVAVAQ